jgi:hypothetical protein
VLLGAAPALAATHYAAANGTPSNWPCGTSTSPCDLPTAIQGNGVEKPASGDEVIVERGLYFYSGTEIEAPVAENIQGATGIVRIDASGIAANHAFLTLGGFGAQSKLQHVQIYGSSDQAFTVRSKGNTVFDDDLFSASGTSGTAVEPRDGDTVLNTVAVATGSTVSVGVRVELDPGQGATLRNVTAYASNASGRAITGEVVGCGTPAATMSLRNVIADAPASTGVGLEGFDLTGGSCGGIRWDVDYSDYDPGKLLFGGGAKLTAGTHNISAPPLFNSPAADDFTEQPNSPTVDQGTDDPADGAFDPDGRPRFLGAAPDMGAYELPAPNVVTGNVSDVSSTRATLLGTVDSEGSDLATTYYFQYGPNTAYGSTAPLGDGTIAAALNPIPDPQAVSAPLTGLQPNTTYDYRLVALNADGETAGPNQTFFTSPAPPTATLTIVHAGNGSGSVEVPQAPASCAKTCPITVTTGTQYTLTAAAAKGSRFTGWSGGGCPGAGTCTLTPGGDATVIATFEHIPPSLTNVTLSVHKRKLSFTVNAGAGGFALSGLRIAAPKGLRFVAVKATPRHAGIRLAHGVVTITVPKGTRSVRAAIAVRVKKWRRRERLSVAATDAAGVTTYLYSAPIAR